MEAEYLEYIQSNPLYIHSIPEHFNSQAKKVGDKIHYNEKVFKESIDRLRSQEKDIYENLGDGDIEKGKNKVRKLGENIYSNNIMRYTVFKNMQQLFGKIDSEGKPVSLLSSSGNSLPISVTYTEKNGLVVKRGKNPKETKPEMIKEVLSKFCNNWNEFVQKYDKALEEINNCVMKGSIDWESNRFINLNKYLNRVKTELGIASSNNYEFLSDSFLEVIRQKTGYWGDIIGIFNEICDFDYKVTINGLFENLKDPTFKFERGDDIDRSITQKSTNAKADNVITITNSINLPGEIKTSIIGTSIKFSSTDMFKMHTPTLKSLPDIISLEGENGESDANYLRYLIINTALGDNDSVTKSKNTIYKILQKYIYLFLSGNINDVLQSKALFLSATFVENGYESYFFPISNLLEVLQELVSENSKPIISWSAISKQGFGISESNKKEYHSQIKKVKDKVLGSEFKGNIVERYGILSKDETLKNKEEEIFSQLSSTVGDKGITMKDELITKNILKIIL